MGASDKLGSIGAASEVFFLSASSILCIHFQLTGEDLQDLFIQTWPSVCRMTMMLTTDPLLLVTKQAAFFFLSILAFNKTGYLATAKAKEPGRGKKAVARDGACLR